MRTRVVKLGNGKWCAQRKHLLGWKFLTATSNDYEYWRPIEFCWCDTKEKAINVANSYCAKIVEVEDL